MGVFGKLRGMVPSSSRSFHELFAYTIGMREELVARIGALESKVDDRTDEMRYRADKLDEAVSAADVHMALFAWQLLREEGESLDDTRKRFFRNIPAATGGMRMLQLGCAQLLREFDEFCSQHGLQYWLYSGTLIGAVRHGGFIPWDDDVDLGMPRDEVLKLIDLAASSERYEVTVRYDWDPTCRQVRFRYRDSDAPCFLDVFMFDYTAIPPSEAFSLMQADRSVLKKDVKNESKWRVWGPDYLLLDECTEEGRKVKERFDKVVETGYGPEGYLTHDPDEAVGVMWGVDNVDAFTGASMFFDRDAILPLGRISFESLDLPCPRDPARVLEVVYGDVYELPGDITSHLQHVSQDDLADGPVRHALEALAQEYGASA